MTTTTRRRVAGFTLIELLVVIGLLAVLTALGTGAYFRVRGNQQDKGTEDTIAKLNAPLNRIWSAEMDNARDSFAGKNGFQQYAPAVDTVKAIANSDADRARALWMYLWMKNAFPQTFFEATNPTTLTSGSVAPTLTASIPARPMFSTLVSTPCPIHVAPLDTDNVEATKLLSDQTARESAILLFRILTRSGARGETFSEDAIGALSKQETIGTITERVFIDTYGNPLAFVRFAHESELDTAAYMKGATLSRDPLDPTGRLAVDTVAWSRKTDAGNSLQLPAPGFGLITPTSNTTRNWLPSIVARGGSKGDWVGFPIQPLPPATRTVPVTITAFGIKELPTDAGGMVYGYKLRRQGNRGDQ